MTNVSQRADLTDPERTRAATTFNGTYQTIGSTLTSNPVIVVFDNQTDVDVPLSVTGSSTWKTFSAGEAFVLDMRANHGIASNFTLDIGTQFTTNATIGTSGSFRISVINTRN